MKCTRCGKVSTDMKEHEWKERTCDRCGIVRFIGHNFLPSADNGTMICSICGLSIDENRGKAALEALKKFRCDNDNKSYMRMLHLVEEIEDPEWVYPIASAGVYFAMERLGQLGADEKLASIARDGNRVILSERKRSATFGIKSCVTASTYICPKRQVAGTITTLKVGCSLARF